VISSPFLFAATINYHLHQSDLLVVKKTSIFTMITGVDILSDAKDLCGEAKSLFAAASMNLREWWASNMKQFTT